VLAQTELLELAALLEFNLSRDGFSTRIFPGSGDTLPELETWKPDLVLLDATHDTIALRSALGEFSSQFPDVPILAMANDPDHAVAVELVKLGVSAYFIVPGEQRKISQQIAMVYNDWVAKKKKEKFVALQQCHDAQPRRVGQGAQ